MLKKITCFNGFRCCGKSMMAEIIFCAFNKLPTVRLMDVSDAIRYYLQRPQTPFGRELQQYRHIMEAGGIIPDGHLIYHICMERLSILDKESGRNTEHLLLPGGMRTIEEAICFDQLSASMNIIHIHGTRADMLTGVARRTNAGVVRSDSSSPEKLKRGWDDYIYFTVPALNAFPDNQRHEIQFDWTMRKKVEEGIGALDILPKRRKQLLRRISAHNHPAWTMIDKLDNPPSRKQLTPHATHYTRSTLSGLQPTESSPTGIMMTSPHFQKTATMQA